MCKKEKEFCDGCCYRKHCEKELEKCCYLVKKECLIKEGGKTDYGLY